MGRRGAGHAPHATHVVGGIGHRPDQRYPPLRRQRQGLIGIFEQHKRLCGDFAGHTSVFGRVDLSGHRCSVAIFVGVLKQSEPVFRLKHAPTGFVNHRHCHCLIVKRLLQRREVSRRNHIHVCAGLKSLHRGLWKRGIAVGRHLGNHIVVGHEQAVESPPVAKHVDHKPSVGCRRNSIDKIK